MAKIRRAPIVQSVEPRELPRTEISDRDNDAMREAIKGLTKPLAVGYGAALGAEANIDKKEAEEDAERDAEAEKTRRFNLKLLEQQMLEAVSDANTEEDLLSDDQNQILSENYEETVVSRSIERLRATAADLAEFNPELTEDIERMYQLHAQSQSSALRKVARTYQKTVHNSLLEEEVQTQLGQIQHISNFEARFKNTEEYYREFSRGLSEMEIKANLKRLKGAAISETLLLSRIDDPVGTDKWFAEGGWKGLGLSNAEVRSLQAEHSALANAQKVSERKTLKDALSPRALKHMGLDWDVARESPNNAISEVYQRIRTGSELFKSEEFQREFGGTEEGRGMLLDFREATREAVSEINEFRQAHLALATNEAITVGEITQAHHVAAESLPETRAALASGDPTKIRAEGARQMRVLNGQVPSWFVRSVSGYIGSGDANVRAIGEGIVHLFTSEDHDPYRSVEELIANGEMLHQLENQVGVQRIRDVVGWSEEDFVKTLSPESKEAYEEGYETLRAKIKDDRWAAFGANAELNYTAELSLRNAYRRNFRKMGASGSVSATVNEMSKRWSIPPETFGSQGIVQLDAPGTVFQDHSADHKDIYRGVRLLLAEDGIDTRGMAGLIYEKVPEVTQDGRELWRLYVDQGEGPEVVRRDGKSYFFSMGPEDIPSVARHRALRLQDEARDIKRLATTEVKDELMWSAYMEEAHKLEAEADKIFKRMESVQVRFGEDSKAIYRETLLRRTEGRGR